MPRQCHIIFLVCASLAVSLGRSVEGATVAEVQNWIASGNRLTIVDLRLPSMFAAGHIPSAINIPASVCAYKNLPLPGKVIVYDDGIRSTNAAAAGAALMRKRGGQVEVLQGYAAWQSAQALTTTGQGLKPETFNYISYAEVKSSKADSALLVDLRRQKTEPLSDLSEALPGFRVMKSSPSGSESLLVLIDNGDGAAVLEARRLKAAGTRRYAILVGGELSIARQGRRGSQRLGSSYRIPVHPPPKQ